MRIEWTDAACDTVAKLAWDVVTPIRRETARNILNLATAEQFRSETDAERAARLHHAICQATNLLTDGQRGIIPARQLLNAALSVTRGSKERGT